MKYGDGASLKALYRFLLQCQTYQRGGILIGLDSPLEIRNIQLKLPVNLQDKWGHIVGKVRKHKVREATFSDFVDFIESESAVLNDPVYSRKGLNEGKREEKDNRVKNFAIGTEENESEERKEEDNMKNCAIGNQPQSHPCPLCKVPHDLDDCPQFLNKSLKDRKQFIFDQRLCFTCFKGGHKAEGCKEKKTCRICSKEHATSLHVYKVSAISNKRAGGAGMCVTPVILSHEEYPEIQIVVHAMIDECSQGCFIKESLLLNEFSMIERNQVNIPLRTLISEGVTESLGASGFRVRTLTESPEVVLLPKVFSRAELPFDMNDIPSKDYVKSWDYLQHIADSLLDDNHVQIGLLIGRNCPKAMEPIEVIPSRGNGPYAYRTRLGWLIGNEDNIVDQSIAAHPIKVNLVRNCWPALDLVSGHASKVCFSADSKIIDSDIDQALKQVYDTDVVVANSEKNGLSIEDRQFLMIMKNGIRHMNGHYKVPLPFRDENPVLPCNRDYAIKRAHSIRRKMLNDESFHHAYINFVMNLVKSGHAYKVTESFSEENQCWYLPHHAVYHPRKGKIRVVFDGAAEYKGTSLNKQLLQGPDLTNQLVGVFLRFRKEKVALTGDIESMYYQVRVPKHQRKYLRFVFWADGDINAPLVDYEMCVHVFGAVSSMGCVNYALRQAAEDFKDEYGLKASETLTKDFYVDDLATSVAEDSEAADLIHNTIEMCGAGGFNLTKIVCSSQAVMETIPSEKQAEVRKSFHIAYATRIEHPLGVLWAVENDTLGFSITFKTGPLTRKGVLSTVNSIFDLLGIAAPFILPGRKVLQKITGDKGSWDDAVDANHVHSWNRWKDDMILLNDLEFPRCYKPQNFGKVKDVSLHIFGDGSNIGYGAACYLRQVDIDNNIAVTLVMGKSRVSPLKPITIVRLELTASAVAVKLGALTSDELNLNNITKVYYTDNMVALGYICNDTKRFKVFVANKQQLIRSCSNKEQ